LNGGISAIGKSLSANGIGGDTLLKLRQDTESALEAFHFGVQVMVRHRNGFELSSGIQVTHIAEKFRLNTTKVEVEMIEGIKERRVDLNGDTIAIIGQIPLILIYIPSLLRLTIMCFRRNILCMV